MRKATGSLLVLSGAVLIIIALLLFRFNRQEEIAAGKAADKVMEELLAVINDTEESEDTAAEETIDGEESAESTWDSETADKVGSDTVDTTEAPQIDPPDEPVTESTVVIGGYEYIGYITVPSVEISLPVMADWDYTRLNTAPCRQFGTAGGGDLVIAGHDYRTHFGRLGEIKEGDTVEFTDADGRIFEYTADRVEILDAEDVDAVQNSGSELVLYTCTYTGVSRIAVFCSAAG